MEPPIETHVPQAPEGGKEPRPVVEPETQLPRGDVRGFLFGCAMPVDRAEARTESDADVEGLTERLRILGPLLKRGQGLLEQRDRLSVGRARHGLLSRLAQVPRRALPHRGAHRMVGQPLHVFGQPVRIEALDRADDAGVQVLAPLLEQRAVGDFMGERVLEGVLGIWKKPRLVQKLRLLQMRESPLHRVLRQLGHGVEQPEGDVLADDRGRLEQLLVVRWEPVDPSRQDHLHGRRDLDRLDRPGQTIGATPPASACVSTSVRMLSSMKKGFPRLTSNRLRGSSAGSSPRRARRSSPALSGGSASSRSWL